MTRLYMGHLASLSLCPRGALALLVRHLRNMVVNMLFRCKFIDPIGMSVRAAKGNKRPDGTSMSSLDVLDRRHGNTTTLCRNLARQIQE